MFSGFLTGLTSPNARYDVIASMPEVIGDPEKHGRLVGSLTGRELEIVFYLAGVGIIIGLMVVAIGALVNLARRKGRRTRS